MQDRFLPERGIAYRINDFQRSRATLVFIHGLGFTCSGWKPFEEALEDDFNILTYDLRGHGLSRKYKHFAEYELELFVDDLQSLIDHLGITCCTLVSNSMGTLIALSYLRRRPTTVNNNFLIAPIYKQHSRMNIAAKIALSTIVTLLDLLPYHPQPGRRIDYSKFTDTADLAADRIWLEIQYLSLRLYLFCLARVYAFSEDGWWETIPTPTTIVHGTQDSFAPYHLAVEVAIVIPCARLITLVGANHILVVNNIPEIVEHLKNAK